MDLKDLRGKHVCVIGAGKSGIGACELAAEAGADIILYDGNAGLDKEALLAKLPHKTKEKIVLGAFPNELIEEMDLAVISPGVPTDLPFVLAIEEAKIPLWGELELAWNFEKGEVLAITGTNGKTTTTSILGHIMRCYKDDVFVVGNIGTPYTEAVLKTTEESVTVAEVSSFQLEKTVNFHPSVTAILNITPDHLNRHHTMANYSAIKESITKRQDEMDTCVLNFDDNELRNFGEKMVELGRFQVVFFSSTQPLEHGFYLEDGKIIYDDGFRKEVVIRTEDLRIIGRHNHENVMAASAMAMAADVPLEIIQKALPTFLAVPHRIEFVGEVNGVVFYNDSKGTNPDAAIKAIDAMDRPTYLIGGGYDKDADFTEWVRSFHGKVKELVLIGATKEKIKACAASCGFRDVTLCETFEEAFSCCVKKAKAGEAVLLSPACASWGMFDNYEQRGDRFKELVNELAKA